MDVLVSVHAEAKQMRRKHDFRPVPTETTGPPQVRSAFVLEMQEKMGQEAARQKYRLRKQTVGPVFGTIKKWMGFTQFHMRGLQKVQGEWTLLTLAYNVKRLWTMKRGPKPTKKTHGQPKLTAQTLAQTLGRLIARVAAVASPTPRLRAA
jgi:hypothetical protein